MTGNDIVITSDDPYESNSYFGNGNYETIEKMFQFDVLYKMLSNAAIANEILTPEMKNELFLGITYRIDDVSRLTGVDEHIVRNWLNGTNSERLPLYLTTIKEVKFRLVPAETVYRIRMVHLIHKNLKMALNTIASVAIGETAPVQTEIVNPAQIQAQLKKQIATLEEQNKLLEEQNALILQKFSEENLNKYIRLQIEKIEDSKVPLLEAQSQKVSELENKLETIRQNNEEQIKEKLHNFAFAQVEYFDEIEMENRRKNRGVFSKLFNKHYEENPLEKRTRILKGVKKLLDSYEKALLEMPTEEDIKEQSSKN